MVSICFMQSLTEGKSPMKVGAWHGKSEDNFLLVKISDYTAYSILLSKSNYHIQAS